MISYDGIDEAELVHALVQGQNDCAFGTPAHAISLAHQLSGGLTVESVRSKLAKFTRDGGGRLYLDYFCGRALKLELNPETLAFDERLYDRDAGAGAAQRVVDSLRRAQERAS